MIGDDNSVVVVAGKKLKKAVSFDDPPKYFFYEKSEEGQTESEQVRNMMGAVPQLKYARLSENASCYLEGRSNKDDVGLDLKSASREDIVVPPHGKKLIPTDIAIEISEPGVYARLVGRSSVCLNHHISVAGGVIDPGYRGNIQILLFNHSPTDEFVVKWGQRISQLILERYCEAILVEVTVDALSQSERGSKGFGSTSC